MTHEEYENAANFWIKKEGELKKVPNEKLIEEAEDFLTRQKNCVLGTGFEKEVRCTPVDYKYHDGALWIFTEGGKKFRGIEHNQNVSVAIFEAGGTFASLHSIQIQGKIEVITPWTSEYEKEAQIRKIPLEALKKLSAPMNLLKVIPEEADYLDTDLKKQGFSTRQHIVF